MLYPSWVFWRLAFINVPKEVTVEGCDVAITEDAVLDVMVEVVEVLWELTVYGPLDVEVVTVVDVSVLFPVDEGVEVGLSTI